MLLISSPEKIREKINRFKKKEKTIGFVPTMGALHEGHLQLIKQSKKENDVTVISIFVNPTQFGPKEDFNQYPRTLKTDQQKLEKLNIDILFAPSAKDMYPNTIKTSTQVYVPKLSSILCGKTRKIFFRGVCMIVNRLFNLVNPDKAYFGEKDYQQLIIIKKMVQDLFIPIEIIPCPIIREKNGLALSSRNKYLSEEKQKEATYIYKSLCLAKNLFQSGIKSTDTVITQMTEFLCNHSSIKIDYAKIVDPVSLQTKKIVDKKDRFLFAGYLGKTRLIDNICFS